MKSKKLLNILLCGVLCMGMLPAQVSAQGNTVQIQTGTEALQVNTSKVSFAGYDWWVIGNADSGVYQQSNSVTLLGANDEFGSIAFRTASTTQFADSTLCTSGGRTYYYANNPVGMTNWAAPNEYAGSTLQQKMEEIADGFKANSEKEYNLIASRNLTSSDGISGQEIDGQKLWALSEEEYITLNDKTVGTYNDNWWLRSATENSLTYVEQVHKSGSQTEYNIRGSESVRPALSLDLSSVLFTTLTGENGKSSVTVGDHLTASPVPQTFDSNNLVKFTMKDADMSLSVSDTSEKTAVTGDTVSIDYTGSSTGGNQYISCILTDSAGEVKYYGKLAAAFEASAETGTVNVPLEGVEPDSYTLHIFSEQENGDKYTDFCSEPVTIPLTVTEAPATFTITYKTNADVEMGTLTYTVGEANALPKSYELGSIFSSFVSRAREKGELEVSGILWYENKEFTTRATFPQGEEGKNYTLYCKFIVWALSAGSVSNYAENASYEDVGGTNQPSLGINGYSLSGRNDASEGVEAVFERKTVEGEWVEVPEEYHTDNSGNTRRDMIYFSSVSDSGIYRLKDVRYTATDNNGDVLYYFYASDTPKDDEYTVNIDSVELSITGVTAQDRNCNGTNIVELSGGTLTGVLYGDDVSFSLGTGTVADTAAGSGKQVTTNITLTGTDAKNYTLKQPENITVTISHAADNTGFHADENDHWNTCECGEKLDIESHTGGTATCANKAVCEVCGQPYGDEDETNHANLIHVERKETTHVEEGNIEYWYCGGCDKYFSDEACTQEITHAGIVIPKLTEHIADGTGWHSDTDSHWQICECGEKLDIESHTGGTATCANKAVCEVCGEPYGDEDGTNHENLIHVERKETTHVEEGNIEYWYCGGCDKYFSDEACTQEITYAGIVIPKLTEHIADGTGWHSDADSHWQICECGEKLDIESHTGGTATCANKAVCEVCGQPYGDEDGTNHENLIHVERKETTHVEEGNIEYWYCGVCDKYFSDEACTQEITHAGIVIPKLTEHIADGTGWHSDADSHWQICECGEMIDKTFHTFEWVIEKEGTATESGFKYEKCTVCGYEKEAVEIPATGTTEKPSVSEGDKTDDATGDKTDDATGDKTDDATGDKTDDATGDKTDDATGDKTDDATGDKTDDATGGKTDDATGDTIDDELPPATGNNMNMDLWIALMFAAGVVLICTIVYSRKKKYSR